MILNFEEIFSVLVTVRVFSKESINNLKNLQSRVLNSILKFDFKR